MSVIKSTKKADKLNQHRNSSTIKRLKIYSQKPTRTKKGVLTKKQSKSLLISNDQSFSARIQPDRRWFGNTRVITQNNLDQFREAMDIQNKSPFNVVLKRNKLPISLLEEPKTKNKINLLSSESFENTFGPKAIRKRPKIKFSNLNSLANDITKRQKKFDSKDEFKNSESKNLTSNDDNEISEKFSFGETSRESIFFKGQSKRIWSELYKVIDSSDVVIQVLDARDPLGTRSKHIEKIFMKKDCSKNLVFVLNKTDLIPKWAIARWLKILNKEFPTIAFHASVKKPFGKGSLIKLLRQYAKLHTHRKQISVGFIGYPNVGKSSIINALKKKKVCKVAPIAGETKVWQYVTLFRRIFLIDCPGVVCPNSDSDSDIVLKGVVRVENVEDPSQYVEEVLKRVKREFIERAYGQFEWENSEQFLLNFAKRSGKLLKGGEPDINNCARMVLHDWQRGRLCWYCEPPKDSENE